MGKIYPIVLNRLRNVNSRFIFFFLFFTGISLVTLGQNKVTKVEVGNQMSSVIYGTGSSTTYEVTLTLDGNTSIGSTVLNLLWDDNITPTGTSFSFSDPSPIVLSGSSTVYTLTVTINSSNNTPAHVYLFSVTSTNNVLVSNQGEFTVDKKELNVIATTNNKIYDGNSIASVTLTDNRIAGDDITLTYTSANFADKNAGPGKTVTISGLSISGPDAANYIVPSSVVSSATILKKELTITATGANKIYDGNTLASVTFSDDRIVGDDLNVSYTSANFTDPNIGSGKTINISGINLNGADANNYTVTPAATATGDITASATTIDLISNNPEVCQNTSITLTANLVFSFPGATGTVEFYADGLPIGTAPLSGTQAVLSVSTISPGTRQLTAKFIPSNLNFSESVSNPIVQVINSLPTITLNLVNDVCPNSSNFELGYNNTSENPLTFNLVSGSPGLAGFSPINNGALTPGSLSIPLPSAIAPGVYEFLISVKNANGCESEQKPFSVNFEDNTPPVISCPPAIAVAANDGCFATGINLGIPVVSDNCGTVTITNDAPASFPVGVTIVTWTAMDAAGNTSVCTQQITVVDETLPVVIGKNITILLNAIGQATISASDVDNGSYDNCGIQSITVSKSTFTCADIGNNHVILTVTDNSGNTSTQTVTVTVADNIPPVVSCKTGELYLNSSGIATLIPSLINNGSTDNCGTLTYQVSKDNINFSNSLSFTCADIGTKTVYLRATDASGNSSVCSTTVVVKDTIAPVVICKNITVDLSSSGSVTITAADLNNGTHDNCGTPALSISKTTFTCADIGSNIVTLTATDASGNVSTCQATVIIRDLISPTANTKNATIYLNASGIATLAPSQIDNGSSDNCGPVTLTVSKTSFDCTNKGANTVTLTVTDAAGNSSNKTAVVTVVDNLAPVAVCKPFTLIVNSATNSGILYATDLNNGSTDNCGPLTYEISLDGTNWSNSLSFNCSSIGTKTISFRVTDASGNVSTVCESTVIIKSSLEIETAYLEACGLKFTSSVVGGSGSYSYYWEVVSSPKSTNFLTHPFICSGVKKTATCKNPGFNPLAPKGNYTIRLTVSDGNCKAVKEFTFNSAFLSTSISEVKKQVCKDSVVTYTSSRVSGGGINYNYEWTLNGGTLVGGSLTSNSITVKWENAGDENANNVSVKNSPFGSGSLCVSIEKTLVTVNPLPTPAFIGIIATTVCPGGTVLYQLQTNSFKTKTWTIVGGETVSGGSSGSDTARVKWGNGATGTVSVKVTNNSDCAETASFTVNIVDLIPPTITCPPAVSVSADNGQCFATDVNLGNPAVADNCGIASVTNNAPSQFLIGTTNVIWTVIDLKGNTATCTQVVTVVDNQYPVISCPSNITGYLTSGCQLNVTTPNPVYSDNCSVASVTWTMTGATVANSPATGVNFVGTRAFNVGETTIHYTVTDASGKATTCNFKVTVIDNILPTITCPAPVTVFANTNCTATGVVLVQPTFNDNCVGATVSNNAPSAFPIGITTVTWTVTDAAGNQAICTQQVTVIDNTSPVFTQLSNINSNTSVSSCTRQLSTPNPVITDNCGSIATLTWNMTGATTGTSASTGINYVGTKTFNIGVTDVTYTATDNAGNSSSMTFKVTITDNISPVLSACPTVFPFYSSDPGHTYATLSFAAPTATDNCTSNPMISWVATGATSLSGTNNIQNVQFQEGNTLVTYTATDASGNTATCTFTVKVEARPSIVCPANLVSCNSTLSIAVPTINSGTPAFTISWQLTGATTGSGNGAISSRTFNIGETNIIWTVSNKAGTVNCTQKIIVNYPDAWIGITSNWNDPQNWCNGILPTSTSNISIPVLPSGRYYPVISASPIARVNNLNISPGASLTFENDALLVVSGQIVSTGSIRAANGTIELNGTSSQTLAAGIFYNDSLNHLKVTNSVGVHMNGNIDLYGSLTFSGSNSKIFTNGNLTLKSNIHNTAWVGNMNGGHTITGEVTVERFINTGISENPNAHRKSWQLLAVPTDGTQTINQAWQEGSASPNQNNKPGYGTMIVSNAGGNQANAVARGFDQYTAPGPSIKVWNSSLGRYDGPANTTATPIYNIEGYMVLVRGDRTVTTSGADANPTTLRSKGILFTPAKPPVQSSVAPGLFKSVGNPYASAIDLRQITTSVGLTTTFTVWDPRATGAYGLGSFAYLTKDDEDGNYYATPGTVSYPTGIAHNIIESGQAFMIQAEHSTGTVSFTENAKVSGSNPTLLRGQGGTVRRSQLRTNMFVGTTSNLTLADGTLIQYDASYSNDLDQKDARKLTNTSENLGILSNNQVLAVERRAPIVATDTIFFHISGMRVQPYKFVFEARDLEQYGVEGTLEDLYLNSRTPLSMTGTTEYAFSIENKAASYATNRFRIVFKPSAAPLPVTFVSINASQQKEGVAVEWKVENEMNLKEYIVEKSVDGVRFGTSASVEVNHAGTGKYIWMDGKPSSGWNYYRIRSVDQDGKTQYSEVAKVLIEEVVPLITVYPNPIVNGVINVHLINQPAGNYKLRLLNATGQVMVNKTLTRDKGTSIEPLTWDYKLARGNYRIEVTKPDGTISVIMVVY